MSEGFECICICCIQQRPAGFQMAVQRPGETIIMQRNVGHCVLTVSGLPGFEDMIGLGLRC